MNILDGSAVNVALPVVLTEFGADIEEGAWVVLAYSAMLASTVLLFGQLSDRLGPRRVLAGGFLAFTVASLACGLSSTIEALVGARLFQGIAGGALSATSMAVVGRYVPPEDRGRAIGILTAAAALGALLGAPAGGILSATVGWRWVFFINIPVGIVAWIALRLYRVPEESAVGEWRPDVLGAALSMAGITGLIYAVSVCTEPGRTMTAGIVSLMSLLILAAFFAWQRRCAHPLLDINLLTQAQFRHANLANFFASAFVTGTMFLMPFYLRYVQGLTQATTGFALLVMAGVYVLVSPQAGKLSDRLGGSHLSTVAAIAGALVMLAFAALSPRQGLSIPMVALVLIGLTYGLYLAPNNRRILSLAPPESQGSASGTLRLLYYLGQAIGVAVIESLFSASVPGVGADLAQMEIADLVPAFQAGLAACGVMMAICAVFSFRSGASR
jgi:EmrB/QacA subfamily drug resistance transporter